MYNCVMWCCVINNSNTTREALSHNVWRHVIQYVTPSYTTCDTLSHNGWPMSHKVWHHVAQRVTHVTQHVMPCHTTRDPCHTTCDAMSQSHTDIHILHVSTHKYTHDGFCIEQTTVSWRTRIYAKNCKKCGKNISISCHVENIAMW